LTCPDITAIDLPLKCNFSLVPNNKTIVAIFDFGDNSTEQISFNSTILPIAKNYSEIGYYNVSVYVPAANRTFRKLIYMRRRFFI